MVGLVMSQKERHSSMLLLDNSSRGHRIQMVPNKSFLAPTS
jgi:hypothetical protein